MDDIGCQDFEPRLGHLRIAAIEIINIGVSMKDLLINEDDDNAVDELYKVGRASVSLPCLKQCPSMLLWSTHMFDMDFIFRADEIVAMDKGPGPTFGGHVDDASARPNKLMAIYTPNWTIWEGDIIVDPVTINYMLLP
ncbi:hypothetical protein L1887_20426 [Cichorium endivia]|nr:hypothetical protein L1887_20426 [Cichorium endivia]